MSPAPKPPDDEDSDDDVDVVRFSSVFGSFEGRGDWIDRHGKLLIKTAGIVIVAAFVAFVMVRIWGK